jgi:phospholipid/cholesterol/gamma-HCH transport system substrate-binding protein/paraquat-inducible protein B
LIWGEPPPKIVLPMNGTQGQSGVQKWWSAFWWPS